MLVLLLWTLLIPVDWFAAGDAFPADGGMVLAQGDGTTQPPPNP